jgi:hypothetical protein
VPYRENETLNQTKLLQNQKFLSMMIINWRQKMNQKSMFVGSILVILAILISGCSTPTATPDVAGTIAVNVAVAQTAAVIQTGAALTEIAKVPTETPTLEPALLNTATTTYTPTPKKAMLTLTRDTYCRTGVLSSFPSVELLTKGQTVEVIAINPTNDSYYVNAPHHTATRCWVWGQYATLEGDQAILPVFTSIPTATATFTPKPSANFTASVASMENCGGDYYFRFYVKNTGAFVWESIQIGLYDSTTKTSTSHTDVTFTDYAACAAGLSQGDLTSGEYSYVAAYNPGQFTYDPTGHSITATIFLCRTDTSGGCDPLVLTFKAK